MTLARFFLLALACWSGAAAALPVGGYYMTELPFQPRAINNQGQILGMGTGGAVLYEGGAVTPLAAAAGFDARGLNDRGEVVGEGNAASGERHAFVWRQGSLFDLGTLGGPFSTGAAINNRGWVAGTSSLADGSMRAFLHDGTTMINLNTPYPDLDLDDQPIFVGQSFGYAINEAGAVAGEASGLGESTPHAALYESGVMRDLGVQASFGSRVIDINNRGEMLIEGLCCGVALHEGTTSRWLRPPSGGSDNTGAALNDLGQALVLSWDGPINRGLWVHEDGRYGEVRVRDPHLEVEFAGAPIDMNDAGDILAFAFVGPHGQRREAFVLLSPVPEPATYALWAGGLLLLAAHVRHRRAAPVAAARCA